MLHFATATKPTPLTNKPLLRLSIGLGLWVTAIAVMQMITFEDFVEAIQRYHLFGYRGSLTFAVVLLALEILSVPFLFRLWLSPAARMVSALCTAVVPYVWTFMMVIAFLTNQTVSNAGYFGGIVELPMGNGVVLTINLVWMTLVAISFGSLGGRAAVRGLKLAK